MRDRPIDINHIWTVEAFKMIDKQFSETTKNQNEEEQTPKSLEKMTVGDWDKLTEEQKKRWV